MIREVLLSTIAYKTDFATHSGKENEPLIPAAKKVGRRTVEMH
ncbi:hypothetical protein NIES4075_37360 [Tolypothrix sp. NIES-4075]|nr:hypothetical protein NIES4075_37360 [Tolypothrix sp. NIES-4075]